MKFKWLFFMITIGFTVDPVLGRSPDIVSKPARVEDFYQLDSKPKLYEVQSERTAMRALPEPKGQLKGYLRRGDMIWGYELEGIWLRIEGGFYVDVRQMKQVQAISH